MFFLFVEKRPNSISDIISSTSFEQFASTDSAKNSSLTKGRAPAGKAPFGYKNIRDGDVCNIVVSSFEAGIVRTVYNWYAAGTYSYEAIRLQVKKEFGLTWPLGRLSAILGNQFYHGVMVCKGVSYQHQYPHLITKELYDQVQNRKHVMNTRKVKIVVKQPYLYRGLIKCADFILWFSDYS